MSDEGNYFDAEAICASKKMKLFTIDNQEVHDTLLSQISDYFYQSVRVRAWVSGMKNSNGDWST